MKNSHVTSLLLERLEHIPPDSIWAHRASGVRGSLLRMAEKLQNGDQMDETSINRLINYGFQILENAAREKTLLSLRSKRKVFNGKQVGSQNTQNIPKK